RVIEWRIAGKDYMTNIPGEASEVLAQVGMEDKEVVLRLANVVRRGAFPWKYWPRYAKLGPVNEVTVATLTDLLKEADPKVRGWAAHTLGLIGPQAGAAAPALVARLKDEDREVRRAAARALGQIGPRTSEVVPGLANVLKDGFVEARHAAAVALEQ